MNDRSRPAPAAGFAPGGVFRAALDAVLVMDVDGIVRDVNPAAERTFGLAAEDAIGRELAELIIPPALRASHRAGLQRFRETGELRLHDRRMELTGLHSDGHEFPIELAIALLPDENPPLFAGFIRPVEDASALRLARLRVEQRTRFLAAAGPVLDRSLDLRETLRAVAELTVPELAHLTVIDLVGDDGGLELAVAAADEVQQAFDLEAIRAASPVAPTGAHPVAQVLRTGESILLPSMDAPFLRSIAASAEHFEHMRRVGYSSAIVVPLGARGRLLGTLSLLRTKGEPAYDGDDLLLADELARRAAFAVDNARLFESTQTLARTLQESLLPRSLPFIPGVQITSRYSAAQEGQDVGGDFYDAFTIDEGRYGLVIGDVTGKGARAAALTALARHTIRAVAGAGASAGRILELLNAAVIRDAHPLPPRFVSALVGLAEVGDGRLRLELAAGGHPPPIVRRTSGEIEVPRVIGRLLGVMAQTTYESVRLELEPGDTILLYTDGLTDARAPARILTEGDLSAMLVEAGERRGDELAAWLEEQAVAGERPRDDIAILIVDVEGPAPDRLASGFGQGASRSSRHPSPSRT